MHTFPLFFHEINKFPVHKTQHGGDVHVIGYARRQHGVVINSERAEDIFSTPTSLVLTFCRNTVEVKDVRKGEKKKHRGGGRNIDSRSAKHRGEWGWRTTPPSELARENKSTAASSPPNAKILIYFFFYLQLPSKWWIKQTETAACAQPNYAALRGGASPARPAPQWTMRGAARCSAAAIGWFKRRLFFFLDILAAHQSIFSIQFPASVNRLGWNDTVKKTKRGPQVGYIHSIQCGSHKTIKQRCINRL